MIAHYDDFHKLHFHLLVIAHRRPEVVTLSKMQLSLNLDLPFAELNSAFGPSEGLLRLESAFSRRVRCQ